MQASQCTVITCSIPAIAAGVMHFLVFLWIPSYYNQNYGIDIKESALLSIFPWACAIVATLCTGAIADALANHEVLCLTHVRKLMQGIGSFGPAGCLFYLAWLNKVSKLSTSPQQGLNRCESCPQYVRNFEGVSGHFVWGA